MSNQLTAKDIAKLTGLSQARVLQWAKDNEKPKFGRSYVFAPADADLILATKGKVGAPRKAKPKD